MNRWKLHSPLVAGLLAALAAWFFFPKTGWPEKAESLLGSVLNISAIFIGFLATVWSIVISMEDRKIVQFLKNAGYENELFDRLSYAIYLFLLLTVVAGFSLLVDLNGSGSGVRFLFAAFGGTLAAAIGASWLGLRLFSKILRFKE